MSPFESSQIASQDTLVFQEAASAAAAVKRQVRENHSQYQALGKTLRHMAPGAVITVARGSSDHASVYAKYLCETQLGVISSAAGLSVNSIYKTPLNAQNTVCLAISQSGQSPDLLASVANLRKSGAFVIALVNVENAPLSGEADETLPLCAGPEHGVAATKSYLASMAALLGLVAHWRDDNVLRTQLEHLPDWMEQTWNTHWSAAEAAFTSAKSAFVLGRGLGYGTAREAALKFKEICALHAEAYSAAEVLHGPTALIEEGFPILAFTQQDSTHAATADVLTRLASRGADIFAAGVSQQGITPLDTIEAPAITQPILMAQSFYRLVNTVALARGRNPDCPPNLSKVTETV